MEKLIVKLPGLRKSNRIENIKEINGQQKKTSRDRTRKYREKLKKDRQGMEKLKENKKLQNKTYKKKLKKMRQSNENLDKVCKIKQNLWKQKNRKKKMANKSITTTSVTKKSLQNTLRTIDSSSRIRKRAERVRRQLPESPRSWVYTISHIIKNATPRRRGELLGDQNIKVEDDVLHINTAGRPSKDMEKMKKSLAFTNGLAEVWKKKRSINQYKK
jgi:myosin heavy subunit